MNGKAVDEPKFIVVVGTSAGGIRARISEVMESTFWTSLRMMEERRVLHLKLGKKDQERGYEFSANRHFERAKEMELHVENLKKILFTATNVD